MAVIAAQSTTGSELAAYGRAARRRRAGALLIDVVVYSVISIVVNNVYGITQVTSGSPPVPGVAGSAVWSSSTSVPWVWLTLVWLAYYIVPETLYGASLGKLLTGICVVRSDGTPLGLGAVASRNVARFIDVLPFLYLLGGISVLVSPNSQRFGDWAAKTMVVGRDHVKPGDTRQPLPGTNRILLSVLSAALVFTAAFAYFGRPPLVLRGDFNQGQMLGQQIAPAISAYRLGIPNWGWGTVTYPITGTSGSTPCTGTITLTWEGLGWQETDSTLWCRP